MVVGAAAVCVRAIALATVARPARHSGSVLAVRAVDCGERRTSGVDSHGRLYHPSLPVVE